MPNMRAVPGDVGVARGRLSQVLIQLLQFPGTGLAAERLAAEFREAGGTAVRLISLALRLVQLPLRVVELLLLLAELLLRFQPQLLLAPPLPFQLLEVDERPAVRVEHLHLGAGQVKANPQPRADMVVRGTDPAESTASPDKA